MPKVFILFFSVVFFYTDIGMILSVSVLTSFQKWEIACFSNRTSNEKESLPHMTPLQLNGRDKLWCFRMVKERMALHIIMTFVFHEIAAYSHIHKFI